MAEHADRSSVDGAVTGDDAVAEQGVGVARCLGQRADLQEAARIEQRMNPGACGRNSLLVPAGLGLLIAGIGRQFQLLAELGQQFGRGLVWSLALALRLSTLSLRSGYG